ncbi:MAG: Flagellar motor switch protein FliG [Candidatus Ozemobacter sibiricus]|uniref:Flagellar motor switch protein FliG n=1 Tax=Candidatus Ozemobacter sibiricus TaxID=2268124 RepID=A0A367ZNC5_9BACT|nr:MAG: Flagellar motor switch protein FliG [Candidatus Ozemobacter sibiricus]
MADPRSPATEGSPLPEPPRLDLPGRTKAAILLIFLGPETSGTIFQSLNDAEIEMLTIEIARQRKISTEAKEAVLFEFEQLMMAREFYSEGGLDYAKGLLEKTVGPGRALEILSRMGTSLQVRPFEAARTADPSQLATLIQNEHPQTICLILAYLQPEKAAMILQSLPPDTQTEIAKRLALMDRTSPEITREVENYLEKKLSAVLGQDLASAGGIDALVNVLNQVDRATEKTIIETMEVQEPSLAEEVKKRLFVFEDVVLIDDRGIQRLLKEIDPKDLSISLKGVTDEVKEKFYKNMSKRAAEMLKEEMAYMGPVRIRDVDQAQQRIVAVVKNLEAKGEIIIARPGEEELIG